MFAFAYACGHENGLANFALLKCQPCREKEAREREAALAAQQGSA